jgi:hypothetical protein
MTTTNVQPAGKVCGKPRHHDPLEAGEAARERRGKVVWCDQCEAFHVEGGRPEGPSLLRSLVLNRVEPAVDFDFALERFVAGWQSRIESREHRDQPPSEKLRAERLQRYVRVQRGSCACAFVDITNGDIFKPAGWKGPARAIVRGNIYSDRHGMEAVNDSGFLVSGAYRD